jgi:hypothetical protein
VKVAILTLTLVVFCAALARHMVYEVALLRTLAQLLAPSAREPLAAVLARTPSLLWGSAAAMLVVLAITWFLSARSQRSLVPGAFWCARVVAGAATAWLLVETAPLRAEAEMPLPQAREWFGDAYVPLRRASTTGTRFDAEVELDPANAASPFIYQGKASLTPEQFESAFLLKQYLRAAGERSGEVGEVVEFGPIAMGVAPRAPGRLLARTVRSVVRIGYQRGALRVGDCSLQVRPVLGVVIGCTREVHEVDLTSGCSDGAIDPGRLPTVSYVIAAARERERQGQRPVLCSSRSSANTSASGAVASRRRAEIVYAASFGKETFLFLAAKASSGWARGTPSVATRNGPDVAAYAQANESMPARHYDWVHRSVRVHTSSGFCDARVADLVILSVVRPHFGEIQRWNGRDPDGGLRWTDSNVAARVFNDDDAGPSEGRFVAARLDRPCAGAVWARRLDRPEPMVLASAPSTDPALRRRVETSFRRLPAYQQLQREWSAKNDPSIEWAWSDGPRGRPDVKVWLDRAGAPRAVTVTASVGGCSDGFTGSLAASFASGSDLALVPGTSTSEPFLPLSMLDLDGDGQFEIIGQNAFGPQRRVVGTTSVSLPDDIVWPDRDCGC